MGVQCCAIQETEEEESSYQEEEDVSPFSRTPSNPLTAPRTDQDANNAQPLTSNGTATIEEKDESEDHRRRHTHPLDNNQKRDFPQESFPNYQQSVLVEHDTRPNGNRVAHQLQITYANNSRRNRPAPQRDQVQMFPQRDPNWEDKESFPGNDPIHPGGTPRRVSFLLDRRVVEFEEGVKKGLINIADADSSDDSS